MSDSIEGAPLREIYKDGHFPVGEEVQYGQQHAYRSASEEKRAAEKLNEKQIEDLREAAEVHRQVRKFAMT